MSNTYYDYRHNQIDRTARVSPNARLCGHVTVKTRATIEDGANIEACSIISADTIIRKGAQIGVAVQIGYAAQIGENAVLGNKVEIDEHSIIGNGVKLDRFITIGRCCVIDPGVELRGDETSYPVIPQGCRIVGTDEEGKPLGHRMKEEELLRYFPELNELTNDEKPEPTTKTAPEENFQSPALG